MAVSGFATGGGSGLSQTRTFRALPWANYRSVSDWIEEFVDSLGGDFDTWWDRFIGGRFETDGLSGRAKLIDLDYEVVEEPTDAMATAVEPPNVCASRDTMLDMLLYLAGIPWPVNANWTTTQKREMVRVGWDALRYKATRRRLLKLLAGPMAGVIYGVSLPPWAFSFLHGDGSPSPGYGTWCVTPILLAGTVATTSGNATVTGTSTAFVTDGSWNGLIILIGNREYWVSSVASATSLTLTGNAAATVSGQTARLVTSQPDRPWLLEATRDIDKRVFPGWAEQGVGFTQFRAGFSSVGEPILSSGARINLLLNEHFSSFSSSTPDSWTAAGTITRSTANASPQPQINHEFTSYCCQLDLTGIAATTAYDISQTATVNNQVAHRFELDYAYTNGQLVDTLKLVLYETDNRGVQWYWPVEPVAQAGTITVTEGSLVVTGTGTAFETNGTWAGMPLVTADNRTHIIDRVVSATELTLRSAPLFGEGDATFSVQAWTETQQIIAVPVGSSAVTRQRLAFDVYPRAASQTTYSRGQQTITVLIRVTSDGTSTTQVVHTLYRVGLYEKHDPLIEEQATGERTCWLPLRDALGWAQQTNTGTGATIENANALRTAFSSSDDTPALPMLDYHPALGRRAYRNYSTWTNVLLQSNDFSAWTTSNATYNGTVASPDFAGFSAVVAGSVTTSSTSGYIQRASSTAAANKSWLHGLWCKRSSADPGYQAGTITITAGSASVTGSGTSFVTGGAWSGVEIMTASGYRYKVASVTNATTLTLDGVAGRTETAVQFKVADVKVALLYGSTEGGARSFFLAQSDGWQQLACSPVTLGAVAGDVGVRVYFLGQSAGTFYATCAYIYDVTSKTDVLYPPVCITDASTKAAGPCYLDAITDNVGTDVNSELIKTALVSVSRGALGLTIVPVYGAASQPNQSILDICESTTANRLHLHVDTGALKLTRVNNTGTSTSMSLTLTSSSSPTSSQVTWRRDEPIAIRLRWDDDGKASLSAGDSNVAATLSAASYSDSAVDTFRIGANASGANPFDGHITDLEIAQVGTPIS